MTIKNNIKLKIEHQKVRKIRKKDDFTRNEIKI